MSDDRFTLHVLHHQEGLTVLGQPTINQRDDVGVIQRRQNLPLHAKTTHRVGSVYRSREELDGGLLGELAVRALGAIHDSHSALTDPFNQSKASDDRAITIRQPRDIGANPRGGGDVEKSSGAIV